MNHGALDQPSAWVQRFAPLVPAGEVLDLACGHGRHARLFADSHAVLAVDRDPAALAAVGGLGSAAIVTLQADLENGRPWPFEARRFVGIVMTNYLHRPLFPHIFSSLAAGGIFIAETFGQGNAQFGKPSNPDFLLAPGELLQLAQGAGLHVIAYEDGFVELPKPAMIQRVCLANPGPGGELPRFSLGAASGAVPNAAPKPS